MKTNRTIIRMICAALVLSAGTGLFAQKPYKVGTTAANFLEIGIGAAGSAMGEAYVGVVNDISSIYWNPAGLAFMEKSEAQFSIQPWVLDINTSFAAVGIVLPAIGTLGLGVTYTGYGEMDVTNMEYVEGTGEKFTSSDFAFSFSFGRKLAQWFSFGASAKFISSRIWHTSAKAMAADMGVYVSTHFFSPTGRKEDGMKIGMSISNYGTRMKYDGMDLLQPIDIQPYEVGSWRWEGNYKSAKGKFELQPWELPLIFRVGFSVNLLATENHRFTVAADALHPNNNAESVNIGGQYMIRKLDFGDFYLRGGYKALFLPDSQYGPTFGGGFVIHARMVDMRMDYAFKSVGLLGNTHCYSFAVLF